MDDDQPHHEGLEARIATAILPTLVQLGYELVRVQVSGKERPVVQIMADRADEATFRVEDCEIISHAVGAVLDVEDPIRSEWSLEVSSAGIDRPLTRVKDWNRYAGQLASVDLQVPQDNRRRLRGIALGADAQEVRLRLEDGTEMVVPRGNIRRAKLVLTDALIEHSAALAAVADARRAALEPPAGEGDAALEPPAGEGDAALEPPAGEDDAALEPPVAEDESAEAPEVEEEAPPAPRRRSTPKRN